MAKRRRLTLTIPPPMNAEGGRCSAECPLYYVAVMEAVGTLGNNLRVYAHGCSDRRGEYRGEVLRPGPRCPWGEKGGGR